MQNQREERVYRVRFKGELLPGYSKESVILAVAKAYNQAPDDIARWFVPGGVNLREEATYQEALQLEGYFRQQGMVVHIESLLDADVSQVEDASLNAENRATSVNASANDQASSDTATSISKQSPEQSSEQSTTQEASANSHNQDENIDPNEKARRELEEMLKHNQSGEMTLEKLQQTLSQLNLALIPQELKDFRPASLLKRLGAFIIDFVILSFVFQIVVLNLLIMLGLVDGNIFERYLGLLNESNGSLETMLNNPDMIDALNQIVMSLAPWYVITYLAYFVLQERFYGATLGKKLFRIRIYSLVTGSVLRWNTVVLRTIFFFLGLQVLSYIPVIGIFLFAMTMFVALRDPLYRRSLYDRVTKTVVGSIENREIK
ncbi:RDD family protein [Ignatzschineria larvae DSM 13226]|uniref:RDD family protein n=1 Tax=Ignatzschineria larvae DSM 13226 TaxID=1111732 RepID=A0ABZ3C2R7_9GAMM|nr:RDD family protein [Ignatzschineria larvae]